MTQFTQLGLSGKPENQRSQNASKKHDSGFFGTQVVAVFGGVLLATSLAGLFLLESGCSQESHNPVASNIQSPITPVSPSSGIAVASTTSTAAAQNATQAPKKVVKKRSTTATYNDDVNGISFSYPKRYALKAADKTPQEASSAPYATNFVQPGGVVVASVELPKGAYPHTNLSNASFNVSVNKNLTAEECGQFALLQPGAPDQPSIQPSKVKLNGLELQAVEAVFGPETTQDDAKYYHVFQNGACYEFALGFSTDGVGDDESIKAVNRGDVFHRLQMILATVKIGPMAQPEVAAQTPAATEPTANVAAATTQPQSEVK